MLSNDKKEVYFEVYCETCKYKDTKETEDPCNDCLAYPYNINSHRPVLYKENDDAKN